MATVTASNAVDYHVWGLGTYSTPEPTDEISWDVLDNDLGDGYRAGIRCGFTAGTRTWTLTLPTVPSLEVLSTTLTDVNGASVSREQYIRSLFDEYKVTGKPFVFPFKGVNYFAGFQDKQLSMKQLRVKIYVSGITLVQMRLPGVTV